MDIKFNKIKELMESKKYIATDEIVWNTIKSIKRMKNGNQKGQDIYSVVLEGPPGAGKSFYAKTYKKVLEEVFNEDVQFLEYQCDSTTGKSDLYEEIRVAAAITSNADEVIISGMLVEAIDAVNSGKKAILLLDEFEKSRRETDAFMYQFLQDGKIKTTQRGIVEIKPEYKKNLQVILCKNDERELSDPLLRRNHIIRLDVMTPANFIKTVNMNLPECDEDMRNIVTLLYEKIYEKKEDFAKFPSCSEGMLAIQDACDLLDEEAPAEVIFADILSNLLKHPDDIETFKIMFEKDKRLSQFVKKVPQGQKTNSAKDEIYRSFFAKEIQELSGMRAKYEKKEKDYQEQILGLESKIKELEESYAKQQSEFKKGFEDKQKTFQKRMEETYQNQIAQLRNQINELKKSKGTVAKNEEKQEENNQKNTNNSTITANDGLDLFELKEADTLADETVYMPLEIVNNKGSIFDGIDKWYEIMQFEVDEEGWEAIQEVRENGIESYQKFMIEQINNNEKWTDLEKAKRCKNLLENEENYKKSFYKGDLCFDGMILDKNNEFNYKIVCKKVKIDGKNFYKIYSNRKIQLASMFSRNFWDVAGSVYDERESFIGIRGLKEILEAKNKFKNYSESYFIFSGELDCKLRILNYIKKGDLWYDEYKKAQKVINNKYQKKLAGLFWVKETGQDGNNDLWVDDNFYFLNFSPYNLPNLKGFYEEKLLNIYEELLEREFGKTNEVVVGDTEGR